MYNVQLVVPGVVLGPLRSLLQRLFEELFDREEEKPKNEAKFHPQWVSIKNSRVVFRQKVNHNIRHSRHHVPHIIQHVEPEYISTGEYFTVGENEVPQFDRALVASESERLQIVDDVQVHVNCEPKVVIIPKAGHNVVCLRATTHHWFDRDLTGGSILPVCNLGRIEEAHKNHPDFIRGAKVWPRTAVFVI